MSDESSVKVKIVGDRGKGPGRRYTPYHAILYQFLESVLPEGYKLSVEHQLYKESQRVDVLIIRQESVGAGEWDVEVPSLVEQLGEISLIEFKSPGDELEANDINRMLGYCSQYAVMEGVGQERLTAGFIVPKVREGVLERFKTLKGELTEEVEAAGIWRGWLGCSRAFVLETSKVWSLSERDKLWYVLSPEFEKKPEVLRELTREQVALYNGMYERLKRLSKEEAMPLRNQEELMANLERSMREYFSSLSPEERFKGATLEQRVAGLAPEQVLRAYSPSELLRALPPEVLEQLRKQLT
ncbi:MAG: hypothetical protein ACKO6N_03010 [Myxococcota bacterium]